MPGRVFEFDQTVPVTLELIGTRVHPEDLPVFQQHVERARGDGGEFEFDFRLQMYLQKSQVISRVELADDLPPVTGDRVQLQQVVLNLLLDAADAMTGIRRSDPRENTDVLNTRGN